jgi:hypothetical protein
MADIMIVTSIGKLPSLRTSHGAICHHRPASHKVRGPEMFGSKEVK